MVYSQQGMGVDGVANKEWESMVYLNTKRELMVDIVQSIRNEG